jgi:hypothetical protein
MDCYLPGPTPDHHRSWNLVVDINNQVFRRQQIMVCCKRHILPPLNTT